VHELIEDESSRYDNPFDSGVRSEVEDIKRRMHVANPEKTDT
jgi:hypothetical protein